MRNKNDAIIEPRKQSSLSTDWLLHHEPSNIENKRKEKKRTTAIPRIRQVAVKVAFRDPI